MSSSRSATRLDPRAPLVLDTRELGRRPGSMRRVQRTVPAPDGWALDLVRVPAGSDVALELRLESVVDGVLVSGTVRVSVDAECGRCLEPLRDVLEVEVQELFAYDLSDADEDAFALDGDFIDLEPLVRDAVVLGLPFSPVCDDACPGLCSLCGEPLAEIGPEHAHDESDPRWAALAALRPTGGSASEPPAPPEIGS